MLTRRIIAASVAASALLMAPASHALPTESFEFGHLISTPGQGIPNAVDFATLVVQQSASNVLDFTLSAKDLNALFNSGAFIGAMATDVDSNLKPTSTSLLGPSGVAQVKVQNSSGPGGNWDFWFRFGQGNDKLTSNESVSWRATFAQPTHFVDGALHVQGLTAPGGNSGWYAPPVPEPEAYALLLAGLGMVGVIARRRLSVS